MNRFKLWLFCAMLLTGGTALAADDEGPMQAKTFKGLELRGIGPALMSGRIADIAIHPDDDSVWYVAVGSGNVWKTVNSGTTWEPIFDEQGAYSIGTVSLDPNNSNIVWVGTGENVSGRHVGYGDGVYRSLDGGKNWDNMGLKESEHIGTILVHPEDSSTIYVAAQGPLWSKGGDRGLFRSTDAGENWEKLLGDDEYTGVNEVRMDPRDPNVLYAVTHERYRNVAALVNGGPGSGIHKSTDGGDTWRELTNGLPDEDMGKIGIAISPQQPDVIYATIELAHREGGLYRSADGGETWEKGADYISGGTGPHYYQEIFASPHKFDRIYQMDVQMHVSEDGGKTFTPVPSNHKHSDNHALAFSDDPNYLLSGNDGGLYESWDLGQNWKFIANLPVTQFYKVAVDYAEPFYNVYGGTQDNMTQGGPSRTMNQHGIRNADWFITVFADGHQPAVDPTNPDIVYSEWQQGNLVRHDRKTGEIVYIQPQPAADEPWDRFNWDAPILISPHDPKTLYYASQRVWRSDDRGDSWTPISGDLTRGLDRLTQPTMGRVQSIDAVWDLYAMSKYGTITSLSQSPLDENLIYAGTDDGIIQVSEDGGESWRRIDRLPKVPDMFFVNDIKADLHDADTVYVAVDDHKSGDFSPYLLKSTNRGRSWRSISDDLPERHLVWRVVQDHVNPELLFAGTEFGVFFSVDGGEQWIELQGGVPTIAFRDLAIQTRENDLVGATFGRGFYILDDYSPLREVSADLLDAEAHLFEVRDADWYVERRPLGYGLKASQGEAYYSAPNPPFGAIFTYYLKDELKTAKEMRREQEKELAEEGEDTPYPGWDTVLDQDREEEPAIVFTVRNAAGEVVRRIEAPAKGGIQRASWDLRYPAVDPWEPDPQVSAYIQDKSVLAEPGTYSVSMAKRVDGEFTDLGEPRSFDVVPVREATLTRSSLAESVAFARRVEDLNRRVSAADSTIDETRTRLGAIRETLMRSTLPTGELDQAVRAMEDALHELDDRLTGAQKRAFANDPGPVSISRRLAVAAIDKDFSAYGPTPTHERSLEIAEQQFETLSDELEQLVDVDLPALEDRLDAAGVPWTPGRSLP